MGGQLFWRCIKGLDTSRAVAVGVLPGVDDVALAAPEIDVQPF
jgi:hypothetical protein